MHNLHNANYAYNHIAKILKADVTQVSRFCHAEAAHRLTKHLLPLKYIDSSTPLRSAQNDRRIILCLCVTSVKRKNMTQSAVFLDQKRLCCIEKGKVGTLVSKVINYLLALLSMQAGVSLSTLTVSSVTQEPNTLSIKHPICASTFCRFNVRAAKVLPITRL